MLPRPVQSCVVIVQCYVVEYEMSGLVWSGLVCSALI